MYDQGSIPPETQVQAYQVLPSLDGLYGALSDTLADISFKHITYIPPSGQRISLLSQRRIRVAML